MKKRVLMIAALVSGTLAISGCTTNPYTGEREAGKSGIGAGIGSLVGAGVGALSSSKHDRGKGALIGAAAGAALGGGIGYYMDVQEAKLRDKMQGTGVSVTRNGDNIVLNMPNNVTFDSNSANLKPAGANTLTGVAMVLKEYEKTAVNVVGYTDSTGSKDLNMRLSQQRADSVASALITQGVAANRIRTLLFLNVDISTYSLIIWNYKAKISTFLINSNNRILCMLCNLKNLAFSLMLIILKFTIIKNPN